MNRTTRIEWLNLLGKKIKATQVLLDNDDPRIDPFRDFLTATHELNEALLRYEVQHLGDYNVQKE